MVRKCLFCMLLFIGTVHFSLGEEIGNYKEIQSQKNQKASPAAKEKDFYITPRFGLSTLTGLIGIELQYKHFAFDIGYFGGPEVQEYLTLGIKYYVNSHRSTAYVGLGRGIGMGAEEGESYLRSHIGPIFGYRWRWGKGWDFNLGIGFAFGLGKDAPTPPMAELAFGYSF